jgi:hypothetical protein
LVGIAFGTAEVCITAAIFNMPFVARLAPQLMPNAEAFFPLWLQQVIVAVLGGLSYMFLLNLSALVFRRQWLAVSIFMIATALVLAASYGVRSPVAMARPMFLSAHRVRSNKVWRLESGGVRLRSLCHSVLSGDD